MAKHILTINDSLPIKDLGEFMYDNKVMENDEIVMDTNTFTKIDFVVKHVLFLVLRECVSINRRYARLKPLEENKIYLEKFNDSPSFFSKVMLEETGVKVIFN